MLKTDLSQIAKGVVDIEIKGRFSERFLNLAFQADIDLKNIRDEGDFISARVRLKDMSKLRDISRRSHCAFRIKRRLGMPFVLANIKRRPVFLLMAALGIFLFFFISSFIFSLEVSGPYAVSEQDKQRVLELAAEMGIEEGKSRWGKDIEETEQHILLGFNQLVFAQIEERGVHLTINVVKRIDVSPEDQMKDPGHVVAAFDGIVEDILVRQGTAAVEQGDAVIKGDILIYGWQGKQAVAADGIVTARVWAEGYGECALVEEGLQPSGAGVSGLFLKIADNAPIHLAGVRESPYPKYVMEERQQSSILWRKTGLTVEIISREIGELVPFSISRSESEARALAHERAEDNAMLLLMSLLGDSPSELVQVMDRQISDIELSGGPLRAHAVLEGLLEVGVYQQADDIAPLLPEEAI